MTKKPFAVRNGRPQAPSVITRPMNRGEHAAKYANSGTSEGATKGWETRRADGGTVVTEKPAARNDDDARIEYLISKSVNKSGGTSLSEAEDAELAAFQAAGKVSRYNALTKRESVSNAGTSEGAAKGWLTRKGGVRVAEEFDHEDGRKHVRLTVQGQEDGQKNVELNLPKETHAAIVAGQWKPNKDWEKHSKGEDFHTIHGYEPVAGLREKYGKGSEVDKINGIIGGQIARAKAYYTRSRDFADGSEAQLALKAKAESILKEVNGKHRAAMNEAKQRHAVAPVANRDYLRLLNSFRSGALVNYSSEVQEMLDEVAEYAERGEALPWDLMADYEDWLEENA